MERIKEPLNYLYNHTLVRYLFVGGTTFIIDFGGLVLLHAVFKVNVLVAASISYWVAIVFNFLSNRRWTFSKQDKTNLHKHIIAYAILLGFNYLFTIGFIAIATHLGLHYTLAKIVAVIIQTSWNYFVYKKYVFIS